MIYKRTNLYDKVFVTNLPAFYKINLFNEIALKKDIFVIFTHSDSKERNNNFFEGNKNFEYYFLPDSNKLLRLYHLIHLIRKIDFKELIMGGYDEIIFWLLAFTNSKKNNSLIVESSILESRTTGIAGWLKRQFMKRVTHVYASGKLQSDLCKSLRFNGRITITKGVGIFNIVPQPPYTPKKEVKNYIYVGRFSPEKNIEYLIATFNSLPEFTLNLIGYGPEEKYLKTIAKENINFLGSISNEKLYIEYQKNDVFILPSLSEPWGLVVEEALNNGLPVIVSNKVGCIDEVVKDGVNGIIFEIESINGLIDAINKISNIQFYNNLRLNISKMNFEKIRQHQVNCYLNS